MLGLFWMTGIAVMLARLAWQCIAIHQLKTEASEVIDARWQRVFTSIREQYGLSSGIRMMKSTLAEVPMVVGWFAPVVLVPASAFTGLSQCQLKAVLAHELAHIRRHDPVINAIQSVVETLLFFHPAVWWLTARVRHEREHCCDDLAIENTGDPQTLARALVCLEAIRAKRSFPTNLALAANGEPLMQRIQRILGQNTNRPRAGWRTATGLLLAGALSLAVIGQSVWAGDGKDEADPVLTELRLAIAAETMTPDEAFESYMLLVYPGSQAEEKAQWFVAQADEKIAAAVASGDLTREEAAEKRESVRAEYAEGFAEYMFAREVLGMSDAEMAREKVAAELEAAVAADKLTEEEAEEKLAAYDAAVAEKEALMAEMIKIKEALAAGEMTEEEAEELFRAMKEADADHEEAEMKEQWMREAEAIKALLEAGEITEREAEARFRRLKEAAGERLER